MAMLQVQDPTMHIIYKMVSAIIIDWLWGIRDDFVTAVISGHDPQGQQSFKMRAIMEEQRPKRIILIKYILHN